MKILLRTALLLALAVPAAAQATQFGFNHPTYSASESAGGVMITVTRSGASTGAYALQYQVETDCVIPGPHGGTYVCGPGHAGPPDDYPFLGSADRLDFADGETSKTFRVAINDDTNYEGNETFHISLSASDPSLLRSGDTRSTVTIVDDDAAPSVTFSPAAVSRREGIQPNPNYATVTLTRSTATTTSAKVHVRTADGSAVAGTDYAAFDSDVMFPAGSATATLSIAIYDNEVWQSDRTFTVSATSGATATNHATVTILDDESAVSYRYSQSHYDVDEHQHQLPVTLLREGYTGNETRIYADLRTDGGRPASDVSFPFGFVTFAPGETSKTLNVFITDDTIPEPDKHLRLVLFLRNDEHDPHNPAPSTITIHDDDAANDGNATLSIADTSIVEGNAGATDATFVVTLSSAQPQPVTVDYETHDASAKSGSDYDTVSGTLTFTPGQTSRTIHVPILGDTTAENDEQFSVHLSNPSGAHITGGPGQCTIHDDDHAPVQLRGVEFARAGSAPLSLDLYLPAPNGNGNAGGLATDEAQGKLHPLIIWIHGDHWADGSRDTSPAEREVLRGYAVASIDHRLSSAATYPAQINDVKAAVRWLRANASRYDIDPNRIAVWGFGSGGHLAALLGTSGNGTLDDPSLGNGGYASSVQAVVIWAAPLDLGQLGADAAACSTLDHATANAFESRLLGCAPAACSEQTALANPSTYITRDDPPFLLMHGANDCEVGVQQARRFADQLHAAGIDATLKTYDGVGHDDAFWQSDAALTAVENFLDAKLKAPPRRRAMGR